MLGLRLFGGLALDNPERREIGRAGQRRRLALLAILASPPGTPVSRDKLLALLWPEIPADDGRHRLSVALYDLRQALGEDAIAFTTQAITLAPNHLRIDTADFDRAVARQDWEKAVALYSGPFMDGVYLVDAAEFEQWVDQRRSALERSYARALEMVANARAQSGEHDRAVDAWQALTNIDPYSERYAAGLMRALDAAGNRSGALRYAAEHTERLRAELDAEPARDIELLATELKRSAGNRSATSPSLSQDAVEVTAPEPSNARRIPGRRVVPAAVLVTGLIVLTAALRFLPSGTLLRMAPADASATAGTETPAMQALHAGEVHLRAGRFVEAVTAFERALRADSGLAVAYLQFAVAILWADQPGSDAHAAVARALERRDQLYGINRVLLDGFAAWKNGEWHRAEGLYRRALTIDANSMDARHQLGEVLFHYNAVQGRPTNEARAEFERVLAGEPNHYGALWHLAQLAARDGRRDDVARLTDRMLALEPDGIRRLEVEALRFSAQRDGAGFTRLLERLRDADESLLFGIGWRLAIYSRDLDGAARVFALLTDARRMPYAHALGYAQLLYVDAARGRYDVARDRLDTLVALSTSNVPYVWPALLLASAPGKPIDQQLLHLLRDTLSQGGYQNRSAGDIKDNDLANWAALGVTYAMLNDLAAARQVASGLEQYAAGLPAAAARQRDYANARSALIRAVVARQSHEPVQVLRWVDHNLAYRWFGDALVDPDLSYGFARYIRAEALRDLGRLREADAWFATIAEHDPSDLLFLPSALLQRAGLAATRGNASAAAAFRLQASELSS